MAVLKSIVIFLLAACFTVLLIAGFFWVNSIRHFHMSNLRMSKDNNRLNGELENSLKQMENMNEILEFKVSESKRELTQCMSCAFELQ